MDHEEKQIQLLMDYQNTFTSPAGERVIADLKKKIQNFDDSPFRVHHDVNCLIYEEGRRSVLLDIKRMVEKNPNEERQKTAKG
jgi:hypothetical protein